MGLIGCITLAVAAGVFLAFGDRVAAALVRQAFRRVESAAQARGFEVSNLVFTRASFVGVFAIRCDGFGGRLGLEREIATVASSGFSVTADHVVVDLQAPWRSTARVTIQGGQLAALDTGGAPNGEHLTRVNAIAELPFSWRNPARTAVVAQEEARQLYREGRTRLPLRATAVARFRAGREWHDLEVRAEAAATADSGSILKIEREDIARISREYTYPLTESEITIVAHHPARAPMLLRLCEHATRVAQARRRQMRNFPYDAFRHVYWSWLLTREFGADFAELVTDAHEIGATYELGAANRRMDLHNNAVGRAWAVSDVTEEELTRRILTDPNVIRALPADPTP